ncbi:hypothetical protein NKG05_02635 [Oerskovia sp. M15]
MLQEAGFSSDLTTIETTRMWAGTLAAPRPIEEALDLVGLRGRATVPVSSLSGASDAVWTSPWLSSGTPRCCSSTSRPRAWTPRAVVRPGTWSGRCSTTARPSS